jgi:hypothetical protein
MKHIKLFEAFVAANGELEDFDVDFYDIEEMEQEIKDKKYGGLIEYIIPSWAVSPLINGDNSALNDEEIEALNDFTDSVIGEYGNANFILPDDDDLEIGFLYRNDIDNLGSDCVRLYIRP